MRPKDNQLEKHDWSKEEEHGESRNKLETYSSCGGDRRDGNVHY
jgi:hypothetical protein